MIESKKLLFPFLGFIILLLSSAIACGQTESSPSSQSSFITYTNNDWGYAISYPSNWQVEEANAAKTCLISSPSRQDSVRIDVLEALSAKAAADAMIAAIGTTFNFVTLFDNREMQGLWDWYLSYDYEAEYGEFHGEAYFKQTATYLYKIDTVTPKGQYDAYNFDAITSTFELLPK